MNTATFVRQNRFWWVMLHQMQFPDPNVGTSTMLLPLPCVTLYVLLAFCHSHWLLWLHHFVISSHSFLPLNHSCCNGTTLNHVVPYLYAACLLLPLDDCCLLISLSTITCCTATDQWGWQSFCYHAVSICLWCHWCCYIHHSIVVFYNCCCMATKVMPKLLHQPWQSDSHCFASLCCLLWSPLVYCCHPGYEFMLTPSFTVWPQFLATWCCHLKCAHDATAVEACLLPPPVKCWYSNHSNFSDIITFWMATFVAIPIPLNHNSSTWLTRKQNNFLHTKAMGAPVGTPMEVMMTMTTLMANPISPQQPPTKWHSKSAHQP